MRSPDPDRHVSGWPCAGHPYDDPIRPRRIASAAIPRKFPRHLHGGPRRQGALHRWRSEWNTVARFCRGAGTARADGDPSADPRPSNTLPAPGPGTLHGPAPAEAAPTGQRRKRGAIQAQTGDPRATSACSPTQAEAEAEAAKAHTRANTGRAVCYSVLDGRRTRPSQPRANLRAMARDSGSVWSRARFLTEPSDRRAISTKNGPLFDPARHLRDGGEHLWRRFHHDGVRYLPGEITAPREKALRGAIPSWCFDSRDIWPLSSQTRHSAESGFGG